MRPQAAVVVVNNGRMARRSFIEQGVVYVRVYIIRDLSPVPDRPVAIKPDLPTLNKATRNPASVQKCHSPRRREDGKELVSNNNNSSSST